jgi:hypothetical protein
MDRSITIDAINRKSGWNMHGREAAIKIPREDLHCLHVFVLHRLPVSDPAIIRARATIYRRRVAASLALKLSNTAGIRVERFWPAVYRFTSLRGRIPGSAGNRKCLPSANTECRIRVNQLFRGTNV